VLELAVTMPLFVTLLLFGMYLSELVRAKLRLQQAGRFLAWELTAHPFGDPGRGDPSGAFEAAGREAVAQTVRRYRDLDPAEEVRSGGFGVSYDDFQARLSNGVAPLLELGAPEVEGDGGPWSTRAVSLSRQGLKTSLRNWGFNLRGQVRAEVSVDLRSTLLPAHYLDGLGGFFREPMWSTKPGGLRLRSGLVLLADGWQLADGADATVAGGRAGNHRGGRTESGLYRAVRRMRFWGEDDFADPGLPFLLGVRGVVPFELPEPSGAFTVSHAYGLAPPRGRACAGIPGYPDAARGGLASGAALLDHPRPQCFDSAPFRDTQEYASSRYLRLFQARGPWFMGCQRPGADDPSSRRRRDDGDRNVLGVDCEVAP
jgi:hypothetical protein